MVKRHCKFIFASFVFFSCSLLLVHSQSELTVDEIIEKNIQAAGGKENLAQVENFSFQHGLTTFYMSKEGIMKQTEGRDTIITEVILVRENKVKRNCFNKVTELEGLQKSTLQCLAKLWSGLFTLTHFKDKLEFQGLQSFGPMKLYKLTTDVGDLEVEFYIDSGEFTLKRMVLKGYDPSQGKYEVNHDFGPYQEIDGVKIPSSWFGSQVGTRGQNFSVSKVEINQTLDQKFFSELDVNVGEVKIKKGALNGNIVEFGFRRGRLQIATNWTDECIQRAGFQTKDKLILQIGGLETEIDFYASQPPRGATGPGAKFMIPNFRGENYLIFLGKEENEQLSETLEILLPIQVKKK